MESRVKLMVPDSRINNAGANGVAFPAPHPDPKQGGNMTEC
jgi:hypothetical protein